jgi:hypothetical protein
MFELGELYGGLINPFSVDNAPNVKIGKLSYEQFLNKFKREPAMEDYAQASKRGGKMKKPLKKKGGKLLKIKSKRPAPAQVDTSQLNPAEQINKLTEYNNITNNPNIGATISDFIAHYANFTARQQEETINYLFELGITKED